jgi:glutamate 5-kinase
MKYDIDLVGKIGSMALINKEYNDINYNVFSRIGRELHPGYIWVSSGAAEIGRLDFIKRNGKELSGGDAKTDYAAQGQSVLMQTYRQFIDSRYNVRQILVEHQHFNDEEKREHLKALLLRCPGQSAIPIINYNDPVSDEESRKLEIRNLKSKAEKVVECVDNDETASQVACLVKCKTLLIYSGVDGIYREPNNSSTLIDEISGKDIDELLQNVAACQQHCSGSSRVGAHGAWAKLEYIKEPLKNGTTVIIANSRYSLADVLGGKAKRTIIGVR